MSLATLVTFPGGKAIDAPRKSRMEQGDTHYWRNRQQVNLRNQRQAACKCCKGTGEMWVYIDEPAEPCASCQYTDPVWDAPWDGVDWVEEEVAFS